jgi:hypothetical protein
LEATEYEITGEQRNWAGGERQIEGERRNKGEQEQKINKLERKKLINICPAGVGWKVFKRVNTVHGRSMTCAPPSWMVIPQHVFIGLPNSRRVRTLQNFSSGICVMVL